MKTSRVLGTGYKECLFLLLFAFLGVSDSLGYEAVVSEYRLDGSLVKQFGLSESLWGNNWSYDTVAVSPSGITYVGMRQANNKNCRLVAFDSAGNKIGTTDLTKIPRGIGFDNKNNVYVTCTSTTGIPLGTLAQSASIYKFAPNGNLLDEWQPGGILIDQYSDIKVASNGEFFVSSWGGPGSNQMYILNTSGELIDDFGSVPNPRYVPSDMAIAPNGNIFVHIEYRPGKDQWREYTSAGVLANTVEFYNNNCVYSSYIGLEFDSDGFLYTFNRNLLQLEKYSQSGLLVNTYGIPVLLPTGWDRDAIRDFTFSPSGNLLFTHATGIPEPTTLSLLALGAVFMKRKHYR